MHSRTYVRSNKGTSIILFALYLLFSPFVSQAAVQQPTCTLTAKTSAGTYTTKNSEEVYIVAGETIDISWKSTRAKSAERGSGKVIPLSGTQAHTPSRTTTYTYLFTNETSQTTCTLKVRIMTGTFDESSLMSPSTKPRISGSASGAKVVQVQIFKEGGIKPLYVSKSVPVKNGIWKSPVTKKLKKGVYDIVLSSTHGTVLNILSRENLTIGSVTKKDSEKKGKIVAMSVPLLSGGIARGGSTIPLSYLQVINVSNEAATIQGFTITQNGSAQTDAITHLLISDDSDTFHNTVSGTPLFKNNRAFIPIEIPIAAEQTRLFTIKATLAPTITTELGKQLKIDVAGLTSSASIDSTLPIRGTTWTFGL